MTPLRYLFFVIIILILLLESVFDLKKEVFWYKLIIGLDVFLIFSYFFLIIKQITRNKKKLLVFLQEKKTDVVLFILIAAFLFLPRLAAGLIIARFLVTLFLEFLESKYGTRVVAALNLRPSQTLALSFIGIISLGSILLTFPAATVDGRGASFINALFTMTSASCVSGLSVLVIGEQFSLFGQGVILFGIQAGGLGIMVLGAAFAVFVGGSIPARRQAGLREVLDVSTPEGLKILIRAVTTSTIVMEFIGALCLFILWSDDIPSFTQRLWWSLFHSVSAFCNAGIAIGPHSLTAFVGDFFVCGVFIILITAGGLGFFVISDLLSADVWQIKKPRAIWNRLQIQTKVVLFATLVLNGVGMILFLFFEYNGALRGLGVGDKILASLFQTVSLRSTGFNTVPLENLFAPTIIFCVVYMFIGAAPGSTGGGIKVTTAAISLMALRAMLRGRQDVELMGRRMDSAIVSRSLSIVLVAGMLVAVFLTALTATQNLSFEVLLFETVSAFGTVGLSLGATESLNTVGKLLVIFLMYVGRIGPLTLALAVGERKISAGIMLPKGRVAVG